MEALVLAAALRMVGARMQDIDAKLQQPDTKSRPTLARGITPGCAVVDEESFRQTILTEHPLQALLYRVCLLIGASLQTYGVTRMIVQDGQGMAPARVGQFDPTLEVHLPEKVW